MSRGEPKNLSESSNSRRKLEKGQEFPEQEIHAKAQKLFVDSFKFFEAHHELPSTAVFEGSSFDATDQLLEYLDCPDDGSGHITSRQQKDVSIFFDTLNEFVREKRRDPMAREALQDYLDAWRQQAFSVSPNIFNWMSLGDQVLTTARFSRLPETQGNLAQVNVGELVYGLQYCGDDMQRRAVLQKAFDRASIDTKLDMIHFLMTVATDAMAQGEWAEDVTESIASFLEHLQEDKKQSPFVHYAAGYAQEGLSQEAEQPTRGILIRPGDRSVGRRGDGWREDVSRESTVIGSRIRADETSYAEPVFRRISRDAIASFDHSYTPQSFAWAGREVDQPRENVPASQDIEAVLQTLESSRVQFPHDLQRIVLFADERIFSRLGETPWKSYWDTQKHFPSDPDFVEKFRNELRSILSRLAYTEAHFDLFEEFEGNERVIPKSEKGSIDTALLLQELHRPAIREAIERDMGISLVDLSLREQTQLLHYLATVDYQTTIKGFETIQKYGLNGARAFLSCEHGKHFGDAILQIAERLDASEADAVFAKYCEMIDLTEQTTEKLVQAFYAVGRDRTIDRGKLNEDLLLRAKDIIGAFASQLEHHPEKIQSADVLDTLDRFQKDTLLFASMFKTLAKGKHIELQELRDVTFEQKSSAEIDEQEKAQMSDILEENWKSQKPAVADWVRAGFEKKLDPKNTNTRFYLLKRQNAVAAFMRFDERPDLGVNALYAGSLNVSPELKGSALGETMLTKTLDHEAKDHVIYADFFPEVSAGTMYIEHMGWVVVGVEDVTIDEGATKERRLMMERDDTKNQLYRTRQSQITPDKLIEQLKRGGSEGIRVMKFEFPKEQSAFVDAVDEATRTGLVMTRYFTDEKNKKIRYVAFEPCVSVEAEFARAA